MTPAQMTSQSTSKATAHRCVTLSAQLATLPLAILLIQANHAHAATTTAIDATATDASIAAAAQPAQSSSLLQIIDNIANAIYSVGSDNLISIPTTSNQVTVKSSTLPEYGITLTQPPLQTLTAGSTVTWLNVLTNTSYSDETIDLVWTAPATLSNLKVYQDLNNNGILDAGDLPLPIEDLKSRIKLAQGGKVQLIVQALTDSQLQDGDTADVQIHATVAEDNSKTAAATDKLVIVAPSIGFKDKSYSQDRHSDQVGKDVYVETSYAQCNFQHDAPDQVWVKITSPKTGDVDYFKGTETGNNTGKYRFDAPTEHNANKTLDDRIIQTLNGDTLTATLDACIDPKTSGKVPVSDNLTTNIDMVDNAPALVVVKEGDVRTAELGDYVNYSIKIENKGAATAYDVQLKDALPRGFAIVDGTVKVDQQRHDDFVAQGKYKTLSLGNLNVGQSVTVNYRVLIGSSALGGDGINRAIAVGTDDLGDNISSREAQWRIEVSRGMMTTDGIIVGKVYHDINRDGIQQRDDGELGVAGVRIYMENGNFVVTDAEGKYSLYGINAKTHVLKVDRTTLPVGSELIEQSNRNTGDPSSRFVDMKYGELHRADFSIVDGMGDASQTLNDQLKSRSERIATSNNALEQAVKSQLELQPNYQTSTSNLVDDTGCKTNAVLDQAGSCDNAIVDKIDHLNSDAAPRMSVNLVTPPKEQPLEEYLKDVPNNDVQFINLNDGQRLGSLKQMVQVQAPLGSELTLYVGDSKVPSEQIGKTATQQKQQVAAYDYYAVELQRGRNTLRAVATDNRGNTVSETSIHVMAPDSLQAIDTRTQSGLVSADGVSEYQVVISLKDRDGKPYVSSTPVTIDTNIGRIGLKDTTPNTAGTQVYVHGGELLIPVIAPTNPGKGDLIITAGSTKTVVPLQFTANLRPLIAVGIIEGTLSLSNFDSNQMTDAGNAFEQELHELSGNDDYRATGRAAMFLKGKVRGDYLLTLSYDSDKSGERLFRDIKPDEYYPVYGDASAKGYDAQSTSKLYVRVDKGRSFAMYGDLKTQVDDDEGIKLGQYNRTLTGFKGQYEDDNTRITTFAAETATSQRVNETRGLGISGPYPLADNFDAVMMNSETVEVIIRDADNPGVVISRQPLTRFADYEIDPISRSLYLKAPIASQDFNGNPIYLRVTVEVDGGGDKYWVGGIAAKQQLNDKVSIGGSYINSDDPTNTEELASVNSVIKFNDQLKLVAEYARSKSSEPNYQASNQINTTTSSGQDVEGDALRVELTYDDKQRTRGKAYYNQADAGFVTGSSPISAGRTEAGIESSRRLADDKTTLKLDAVYSEQDSNDTTTQGVKASVERKLTDHIRAELGVRYYKQEGASARNIQAAPDVLDVNKDTSSSDAIFNQSALDSVGNSNGDIEGTTVRAKVTATLPKLNSSKVFAEYEQDVRNSSRNATSLGLETPLAGMGRLYARHDLINSLSGSYGLDDSSERQRTVVGFDANYMKDGTVYSEYRSRDAISARDAEAAIGLKNKWYVQEGLTLNTLFERIESLEGDSDNTATAAGIGVEYLANDDYKASGRLEKRWGNTSDTILATAGVAYRYSEDVTLLTKNHYSRIDYNDGHRTMNRLQLGMAYRDYDSNQLDMLGKLEYRLDDNSTAADDYKKDTYLWSWHGNYHPTRPLTLSGHYAGKHSQYEADGVRSTNTAHAAHVRALYDINERWDAGIQTGAYYNDSADDLTYLAGVEVGYSPIANLWLSAGYNFLGFRDDDIAYDNSTDQGGYVRLRFKFDEDLFKGGDDRRNKMLLPTANTPARDSQSNVSNINNGSMTDE